MWRLVVCLLIAVLFGGWTHGKSTFGGGTSQGQNGYLGTANDAPFVNALKGAQTTWAYVDVTCCARPDELDVNGYPLAGSDGFVNHQGYTYNYPAPNSNMRPSCGAGCVQRVFQAGGAGKVTLAVTGGGGGSQTTVSCTYTSNGGAPVAGTSTATTCDTSACGSAVCTMRWVRQITGDTTTGFIVWKFSINSVVTGNTLQNAADINILDETAFGWSMINWPGPNAVSHNIYASNTGQIFNTLHLSRVIQGGFGVWRFTKWMTSSGVTLDRSTVSTWQTRKPTSYIWYSTQELRYSQYVGPQTYTAPTSGNGYLVQYSIPTVPANYSWPGYTNGGTPVRGQAVIVNWSSGTTTDPLFGSVTCTSATPMVCTWASPPSPMPADGTMIAMSGTQPTGVLANITPYFTVNTNAGAGTFQLALSPGGTPVNSSSTGSGLVATYGGIQFCLQGACAPIFQYQGQPATGNTNVNFNPSSADTLGALVYDPDYNNGTGVWLSYSGGSAGGRQAIGNGTPPEISLAFAIAAHVHPWFDQYTLSMVPITDYMTELATYIKSVAPSWMVPRYAVSNEPFSNPGYGSSKAVAYWGVGVGASDYIDLYGMAASLMCQAISNVYNDDRSKYECIQIEQTVVAGTAHSALITSPNYVNLGPAQAGYTQTPAYNWLTAISMDNYWAPSANNTQSENRYGWCYVYQTVDCSSQALTLKNYIDTANAGSGDDIYDIINTWTPGWVLAGPTYCGALVAPRPASCTITSLNYYEGGYFIGQWPSVDKTLAITGATNDTSAVLTATANGATRGMVVTLAGLGGITELNNPAAEAATFAASSTISATNTLLANQAVMFPTVPAGEANILALTPYCVLAAGLSGSQFSVAIPPGDGGACVGSAIAASSSGAATVKEAWFVSAQATNSVTLNVNSSGFGAFSSNGTMTYFNSKNYITTMNDASFNSPEVGTLTTTLYSGIIAAGGVAPSVFYLAGPTPDSAQHWQVWQPSIYGQTGAASDPGPSQWQAIQKFNGTGTCPSC